MSFQSDVDAGLSAKRKFISSRYFYDDAGDRIFQSIMRMPEYYLTNCELEIISIQTAQIIHEAGMGTTPFDLVEFGAGDGTKTKVLIEKLLAIGASFSYVPIDISKDALDGLVSRMQSYFPELEVKPRNAEYFTALSKFDSNSLRPKLVLFLGSSIGNFNEDRTRSFMSELRNNLNSGDKVLIGFDLQKNPATILEAYNDNAGITKAFNINLLIRINRELNANFELHQWDHYATYDPDTGYARSYLISLRKQSVHIGALNKDFHFATGETIHTEVSRKYNFDQIEAIFSDSEMRLVKHFLDCKHYFTCALAEV
jgi:dimethylhistidine N-methyltransferase